MNTAVAGASQDGNTASKHVVSQGLAPTPSVARHILLALTGSVAAIKAKALVRSLSAIELNDGNCRCEVRVICTKAASHFFNPSELTLDDQGDAVARVHTDDEEWKWNEIGDPVLHIELRKWADVLVVAPLSANTLAKLSHGLCDNLVTCVARAWDFAKPFIVAPAMNTMMWDHPFTARHLRVLQDIGVVVVEPVEKLLACKDRGKGALASPQHIAGVVRDQLVAVAEKQPSKLQV